MKITHLCLGCFFPDGFSYQENMLPKFHKQQGHDVTVIASLQTFDKNGKTAFMPKASSYRNEYDIPVVRLDYRQPLKLYRKMKRFVNTYEALEQAAPEILFIHGCQFLDIDKVIKYLKAHPDVRVYVDNHADFSNSATNWTSKKLLHGVIWKRCAHKIDPFVTKWYGVLPARVDFLKDIYKLPAEKIELLVMGADDDKVAEVSDPKVRQRLRSQYGIGDDDFLVMTGGKIDMAKQQTVLLMQAVNRLSSPKVKLLVFGSVVPELKDKVLANCSDRVQYIGWIASEQTYAYFSAADLAVFPGRHSVLWEQVAGLGIPMACKYWDGTTHVNVGGNAVFMHEDSADEMLRILSDLTENPEKYRKMKAAAQENGMNVFSYDAIAKRSIEQ